jgi:hypothetical protein
MKEKEETSLKETEEINWQEMYTNQQEVLRMFQEEEALEKTGRYRRQKLILLEEQNQVLKNIGKVLNIIFQVLTEKNPDEKSEEEPEVEEQEEEFEEPLDEEEYEKVLPKKEEKKISKEISGIKSRIERLKLRNR